MNTMSIDEKIKIIVERWKEQDSRIVNIIVLDESGMPIYSDTLSPEIALASGSFARELYEKAKEVFRELNIEPDVVELGYTNFSLVIRKKNKIFLILVMKR